MSRAAMAAAAVAATLMFASSAYGWVDDELYGITDATPPHLVSFAPVGPTVTFTSDRAITGLTGGDTIIGMDVSPRDGGIYVLAKNAGNGNLYVLDANSAALTLIAPLSSPISIGGGSGAGTDFNPQSNLLRVITTNGL